MITTIAEHSVDLELLPEKSNILDLCCRGFLFADYMRSLGHNVVCVDIDHLTGGSYHRVAISDYNGRAGVQRFHDPQATQIKEGDEVACYTLENFIQNSETKFDLIKIDVEGAEYQIIQSLTVAPAKQLSIEFHLHTGAYTQNEMKLMETKLMLLGYEKTRHELTAQHGAGFSYWDSLFIHPSL